MYRAEIEKHLTGFLPDIDQKSSTLYDSMSYSLMAGGKRIRPVLTLAVCDMLGGEIKEALPYACAIEYIHTYSLIHDDLPAMDDDDLRRGKPSNHIVYGEAIALLAGDGLLTCAMETMIKDLMLYMGSSQEMNRRIRAMGCIIKGSGVRGMIGGQLADIEAQEKSVSPELLDYIHLGKTAALVTAAVCAGAYIAGADREQLDALTSFGENLGLAFQIADDLLDVRGNDEETGKHCGKDAAGRKAAYPAVHGMEESQRRLDELTACAEAALKPFGAKADYLATLTRELAQRKQ